MSKQVWFQVLRYMDAIREVSARKAREEGVSQEKPWGESGIADYFPTREEAAAHLIARARGDVERAEKALAKERARLVRLRKKYPDAPEWQVDMKDVA